MVINKMNYNDIDYFTGAWGVGYGENDLAIIKAAGDPGRDYAGLSQGFRRLIFHDQMDTPLGKGLWVEQETGNGGKFQGPRFFLVFHFEGGIAEVDEGEFIRGA